MKIIRIAGYNIASLAEPFELDFTRPPLSETDIFAITGPTGAGKSTLFDVICLALYDKSPRLAGDERNDSYLDEDGNEMNSRDARALMHRGAAECLAEVSFVVAGKSYTARRKVRRARNNPRGRMQQSEHTLIYDESGETFKGKKKEILERIKDIIGLSFDQFTRAVMLAQGDFASFLRARDDQKSDILMHITGKEIYKTISKQIFERHKEKRNALVLLKEKSQLADFPSSEALQQCEEELQSLRLRLQEVRERGESIATMEETLRAFSDYSVRLSAGWEQFLALQPTYETLPARELKLKRSREMIAARAALSIMERSRSVIEAHEKEVVAIGDEIVVLQQRLAAFDTKIAESDNVLRSLEARHRAEEPVQRAAESKEKAFREAAGERSELVRRLKETKAEQTIIEEKLEAFRQENTKIESQLQELDVWFQARSAMIEHIGKGKTLLARVEVVEEKRKVIASQEQIAASSKKHLASLVKTLETLENKIAKLEEALPENIFLLRRELSQGQPCPVCGSTHHPLFGSLSATPVLINNAEEIERLRHDTKIKKAKLERERDEAIRDEKEALKRCAEEETALQRLYDDNSEALEALLEVPFTEATNISKAREDLEELLLHWKKNVAAEETLSRRVAENVVSLREMTASRDKLHEAIGTMRGRLEGLEKESLQLSEEILSLLGHNTLAAYEKAFNESNTACLSEKARLSAAAAAERGKLQEKRCRLVVIETELPAMRSRLEREEATFSALQKRLSFTLEELAESASTDIEGEAEAIACFRDEYKQAETIVTERIADIAALQNANPDFAFPESPEAFKAARAYVVQAKSTIQEELTTVTGKIAESELFLKTANERMASLQKVLDEIGRKQQEVDLWARLNGLYGSASGDSFNIRAQGFTLDRLIEFANLQLKSIAPRYNLRRVPSSLALEVIDLDMMELRRAVNSLSGGETFLVSLALSLALSEISSYQLQIESLFIDEGFGSLDEATLNAAMDALERLRRGGRTIGIISHVKEMTRRLPVRIEVSKSGQGQSRVTIIGAE